MANRIKLNRTPEQLALVRAMASTNKTEADAAKLAFAAFVGEVIRKTFTQAVVVSNLFTTIPISENEPQTIPLDPYDDLTAENYFKVTMQGAAGGLPSNYDYGIEELAFHTYTLTSAISFSKKYLKAARLDVVAKTLSHLSDELLRKREDNSIAPILMNMATASITASASNITYNNVFRADTAGTLQADDFVNLMVRAARLRQSSVGGTAGNTNWMRGVTDMVLSPERMADIRRMAFNPVNTRQATAGTTSLQAPEKVREELWGAGGLDSFFGVNLIPIYEMGISQRYNSLFSTFAGGTSYTDFTGGQSATFANSTSEIVLGIDATVDALKKPVIIDSDTGSEFNVMPDDQYSSREKKIGFYTDIQESSICTDSRALVSLIV